MAFMGMYPIGEEAMDLRFAAQNAIFESGIAVIQVKKGKVAKIRAIFEREFWTRPMSTKSLSKKIMNVFKQFGMEVKDDGN